jgi:hypothetical protein
MSLVSLADQAWGRFSEYAELNSTMYSPRIVAAEAVELRRAGIMNSPDTWHRELTQTFTSKSESREYA